jgi:hypothetical protein
MKKSLYATLILILLCSCSTNKDDYLVYVINELSGESQLIFYDPINEINVPILSGWKIDTISLNTKNLLAFSSSHEGNSEIYILVYPFTDNIPVNITNDKSADDYVISWSPDGHYLAFRSEQADGKTLSIWDGNEVSNIYQYKVQISEFSWSVDNRLAFTEFYTFILPYKGDQNEIFVWDGNTITSVSQNPTGNDRSPSWNENGELAFLSERDGEYDIFIWDGISKNKDKPDINSYQKIAPNLTNYFSYPVWNNAGLLTFIAFGLEDQHAQIYEWDGQAANNISKNPDSHNGGQSWGSDGYWSFATFFSSPFLYVRNERNQTQLTVEGAYASVWSQNGFLMFCSYVSAPYEWKLSIWDRKNIVEIAQGYHIIAAWRNGTKVFCSSG